VCQLGSANFLYVGIRWLKRQGVTAASHFDVECGYDFNRRAQPINSLRHVIVGDTLPRYA